MCARLSRTCISVLHITYEEIQPSTYEKQPVEKCRLFSKKCPSGHLVFQNEAIFLPSCRFPLRALKVKISTRGGGVANAKQKYPPDASGDIITTLYLHLAWPNYGLNVLSITVSVTIECKYGNRVPKTKIRRKPDSFELVYTKL